LISRPVFRGTVSLVNANASSDLVRPHPKGASLPLMMPARARDGTALMLVTLADVFLTVLYARAGAGVVSARLYGHAVFILGREVAIPVVFHEARDACEGFVPRDPRPVVRAGRLRRQLNRLTAQIWTP
jgi:hypothetical protein